MFTLVFWKYTAERAVKSFCQALAATLAAATGIEALDWRMALSVAAMTALASVLTSVASSPVGDHASPSLIGKPGHTDAPAPARNVGGTGAVAAA